MFEVVEISGSEENTETYLKVRHKLYIFFVSMTLEEKRILKLRPLGWVVGFATNVSMTLEKKRILKPLAKARPPLHKKFQ